MKAEKIKTDERNLERRRNRNIGQWWSGSLTALMRTEKVGKELVEQVEQWEPLNKKEKNWQIDERRTNKEKGRIEIKQRSQTWTR